MRQKNLHVLVVEDNTADAVLLRQMFQKEATDSFHLVHLKTLAEALVHLEQGETDIVLLDLGLPDGHGIDTIRRVKAIAPELPVIVLTGLEDEVLAARAMKEGAQDYLIKGQIENRALPRALRHAVERHRLQTETDLIRNQQLMLKDEFLSHVSHELRSPLTAIYQFATILADGLAGELSSDQSDSIRIILKNSRQLEFMIDDGGHARPGRQAGRGPATHILTRRDCRHHGDDSRFRHRKGCCSLSPGLAKSAPRLCRSHAHTANSDQFTG